MAIEQQRVGQICNSCKPFWVKQGKPSSTKRLKALSGRTTEKIAVVPACPYCDGDEIFKMKVGKDPYE